MSGSPYWASGYALTNGVVTYQVIDFGKNGSTLWGIPGYRSHHVFCLDSSGKQIAANPISSYTGMYVVPVAIDNNHLLHSIARTSISGSMGMYYSASFYVQRIRPNGVQASSVQIGSETQGSSFVGAVDTYFKSGRLCIDDLGQDYISTDTKAYSVMGGALRWHRMNLSKFDSAANEVWSKPFGDTAKVSASTIFNSYETVGCNSGKLYLRGTLMSDSFWYDGARLKATAGQVLLHFDTSGVYQGYVKVSNRTSANFSGFDSRGNILLTIVANAGSTIQLDTLLSVTVPSFGAKHTIIACVNPQTGRCIWYNTMYSTSGNTLVSAIQVQSGNVLLTGTTDASMVINGTFYSFGKEMFRAEMDSNGVITLLQRNPIVSGGTAFPLASYKTPVGDLLITDFIYGGNNFMYGCDSINAGSMVMSRWTPVLTYPAPLVSATGHIVAPLSQTQATLRWNAGSGRGRLLMLSDSAAITTTPINGVVYSANSIFGNGTNIAARTYVVGDKLDTFITVYGLTPGTKYFAKIVEYNGCGTAIVYELGGDTFSFRTPFRNYYSKSTGDIHQLSTWGHLPSGAGSSPVSFSEDSTTYVLSNLSQVNIRTPNFVISGRGSKLIIGDSALPVHLNIDDTISFSVPFLQVAPNSKLTIRGTCMGGPIVGDSLSTILLYDSKVVPMQIQAFKLILKGGSNLLAVRNVMVLDTLELDARVTSQSFTLGTDSLHPGVLVYKTGCIQSSAFSRYVKSQITTGNSGFFPLAFYNPFPQAISERFVNLNYSTAPIRGGVLRLSHSQNSLTDAGIPLIDTTGSDTATITRVNSSLFSVNNTGVLGGVLSIQISDSNQLRSPISDLRLLRRSSTNRWMLAGRYSSNSGTAILPKVTAHDIGSLNSGTTIFTTGIDDSTLYQSLLGKPTQQATNLKVEDVLSNRILLRWKRGNGFKCMVIARRLNSVNAFPVDSISYTASANFGTGSHLGNQNFVVYSGTLDSVWVMGLVNNTMYHFAVLEFNGQIGTERYLTTSISTVSQATRSFAYYYNKAGQPLNSLGTWGTQLNGGGDTLTSFAFSNIRYRLINGSHHTISDTFTITGENAFFEAYNPLTLHITSTGLWQFNSNSHSIQFGQDCRLIIEGRIKCNTISADYLELNSPFLNRTLVKYPAGALWGASKLKIGGRNYYEVPHLSVRDSISLNGILNTTVMFTNIGPFAGKVTYIQHEYGFISRVAHMIRDTANSYFYPVGVIDSSTTQWKFHLKPASIRFQSYQSSIFDNRYFTISPEVVTTPSFWQSFIDSSVSPIQLMGKRYPTNIVWKSTFGYPDENYKPLVNLPFEISVTDTIVSGMPNINGLGLFHSSNITNAEGIRGNYSTNQNRYTISRKQLMGRWSPSVTDVYFGLAVDTTIVQLPVTWLSFTGERSGDNVQLHWSTSSEQNNNRFEIERSVDGFHFDYIGSKPGMGTTYSVSNYVFTDKQAFSSAGPSVLYYRLKQVDDNGSSEYSRTIAITRSGQAHEPVQAKLFPNPFTQELKLQLNNVNEGDVTVEVFDLSGRKHYTSTQVSGQGTLTLDLSSLSTLAKGVYILNVRNGGSAIQQKLVKLN